MTTDRVLFLAEIIAKLERAVSLARSGSASRSTLARLNRAIAEYRSDLEFIRQSAEYLIDREGPIDISDLADC